MCAPSSSDDENGHASLGKIVTLMSVDTERIRAFLSYSQDCFVSQPLSIVVALVSLFFVLGWSALAGVIMILAIGPIGSYLGNMISVVQEDMMSFTDERVSIMNEILQGIRIVKYFGWEEHFKKKVDSVRQNEMKSIFKLWSLYIGFGNIAVGGGILVAFTTFAFYTLVFKNTLDAATAFTAINLLRVVSDLMSYLPHQIMEIYKAKVALSRINEFLDESELEPKSQLRATGGDSDSFAETVNDVVVGFVQADFGYGATDAAVIPAKNQQIEDISEVSSHSGFTLRNLDVSFPIGKLIVVSGPTGSGKSSLLLALLGGSLILI